MPATAVARVPHSGRSVRRNSTLVAMLDQGVQFIQLFHHLILANGCLQAKKTRGISRSCTG